MTEKEIRKQVKKDFRRTRWANFIEMSKSICLAVLCSLVFVGLFMAPLFIHLFAVSGEPTLKLTHGWIIATGIMAIPGALIYVGFFAMLLSLPIIKIINKIKEHRRDVENTVQYYMSHQKEDEK